MFAGESQQGLLSLSLMAAKSWQRLQKYNGGKYIKRDKDMSAVIYS